MLRTGWTEAELAASDPLTVARLRWLLDAERLAAHARVLEEIVAQRPVPGTPGYADAEFARADARRALDDIDLVLTGVPDG